MAVTEIKLTGTTDYNERFPPRDAKKGYVAKITGRAAGALKYQREFLGQEVSLLEGDEGLYECQRGDKKGGHTRWYNVMLSHPEHGLILSTDCESELPKIAKLLEDGVSIADAIEVTNLRPSEKFEGRMIFDAVARTKSQAKKASAIPVNSLAGFTDQQSLTNIIGVDVLGCWQRLSIRGRLRKSLTIPLDSHARPVNIRTRQPRTQEGERDARQVQLED